jgi:hypothetical protein
MIIVPTCSFDSGESGIRFFILFFTFSVITYEVCVQTGDRLGAGSKVNVKITIFGEYGNTGERQLLRSKTHRNKFQRGQVRKQFHEKDERLAGQNGQPSPPPWGEVSSARPNTEIEFSVKKKKNPDLLCV